VLIKYPKAIFDQEQQRWISDAQIAETTYTAFTSAAKTHQVTARLIVRRVKRLNPKAGPQGQGELFTVYRFHAVFTDSTESTLTAEAQHRDHAIVEQVIADLKSSALAHFPSDQCQWCLVGLRGDGLQPHPSCRGAGRRETRPGTHRNDPIPDHQHSRPHLLLRQRIHHAPTHQIPAGTILHQHAQRAQRTTQSCLTPHSPDRLTRPDQPTPDTTDSEIGGRPMPQRRPEPSHDQHQVSRSTTTDAVDRGSECGPDRRSCRWRE